MPAFNRRPAASSRASRVSESTASVADTACSSSRMSLARGSATPSGATTPRSAAAATFAAVAAVPPTGPLLTSSEQKKKLASGKAAVSATAATTTNTRTAFSRTPPSSAANKRRAAMTQNGNKNNGDDASSAGGGSPNARSLSLSGALSETDNNKSAGGSPTKRVPPIAFPERRIVAQVPTRGQLLKARQDQQRQSAAKAKLSNRLPAWFATGMMPTKSSDTATSSSSNNNNNNVILSGGILDYLPHAADYAVLMQTCSLVRDKAVMPALKSGSSYCSLVASVVQSSNEYRNSSNDLEREDERWSTRGQRRANGDPFSDSDQDDDDDDEEEEEEAENEDDRQQQRQKLKKEEALRKVPHSAGAAFFYLASGCKLQLSEQQQQSVVLDDIVFPAGKRNEMSFAGGMLADKKAGDVFAHHILIRFIEARSSQIEIARLSRAKRAAAAAAGVGSSSCISIVAHSAPVLLRPSVPCVPPPTDEELDAAEFEDDGGKAAEQRFIKRRNALLLPATAYAEYEAAVRDSDIGARDDGMVTDRTLAMLAQRNHGLKHIDVSGRLSVTGVGLSVVACCCCLNLQTIDLSFTSVTDSSVCLLVSYARKLHQVSLAGCAAITDKSVSSLSIWCNENLAVLDVSDTNGRVTDHSLGEIIARCPKLERLSARNCAGKVSDATLLALVRVPFVADVRALTDRELPVAAPSFGLLSAATTGEQEAAATLLSASLSPVRVHAAPTASTSGGILGKSEAACLWTTLKELDLRGNSRIHDETGETQNVTWESGLLPLLQHTSAEQQRRHRRGLRRKVVSKRDGAAAAAAAVAADANTTLVVLVDPVVLADIPMSSAPVENAKPLLTFAIM